MAARRVAVQFIAELAAFRRDMRSGAGDVRRLRDEAREAQAEVGRLGVESERAAARVGRSMREAAGQAAATRGRFAAAGKDAGRAFADGFYRDTTDRLRGQNGRFAAEGARIGRTLGAGVSRGFRLDLPSISGRPLLYLAGGAATATAALQGIPPALAAIGGGLAAIPGLAAGATASIASLALGLSGVGGAIGEVFKPPSGGGGGGGGGIDRTASALRRLEQAERQLRYAQRDAREAQIALNRAREQATRELRDMALQLRGTRLDERSATLSVLEAERELKEIRARSGNPLEIERAQIAYEQAQLTLEETRNRLADLTIDQDRAAKAGVEGSETVQRALRDQERALDAVKDAQYGVLDAQEALRAAQSGGGGGGGGMASEYDKLSANAKRFVDAIRAQKDEILGLRRLAQDRIFAGLDREFTATFTQTLPFARRQIVRFGDTWNETFKQLLRLGRDPQFLAGLDAAFGASDRFFDKVNARIPTTGRMLAQLFTKSVPFVDRFGDSLLSYLDDFSDFIDRASRDGRLDAFFRDAAEQADALLDIGKELLILIGRIGGMRQGSTLLRDMANALERFNAEAHSMRSVEGIIATGNAAVKGMVEVLLILGQTLGETLADPGTRDAVVLFFDILKVGAEIVGTLATLFSRLPDPIQSTVLAGAALLLVGSKIFNMFDRVGGVLGRANGQLGQMGPMGAQAAVGLERVGRAAKAAGIALAAMQIGSVLLDQFSDAEVRVNALTRALDEYGKTGKRTGELQRVFGKDAEETRKIYSAAADGWVQDTARFGESIPIWGDMQRSFSEAFHGQSFTGARENIARLDAELARLLTTSEDTTAAQAAFNAEFARSGLGWDEFKKLLPEASAAMEELSAGMGGANAQQRVLNGTMQDAIRITGGYTDAWRVLNGELLSADEVNLRALEAIESLSESVKRNGAIFDGNTKKARENRIALLRAGEAAAAAAQQKFEETGSIEEANRVYNDYRNQLIATLTQMTGNRQKAIELANTYLKMPKEINTTVNFSSKNAEKTLETFRKKVVGLDGKVVNITVRVTERGYHIPGQGTLVRRWGGITEHAQTGLLREADIFATRAPARYAFAEPATGGEAFIPRYGDRDRSIAIGRRAMDWYGMDVVPKGALAAAHGQAMTLPPALIAQPAPAPVVLEIRSSGAREDDLLVEKLRRAIRVRGGDVQVVLGG